MKSTRFQPITLNPSIIHKEVFTTKKYVTIILPMAVIALGITLLIKIPTASGIQETQQSDKNQSQQTIIDNTVYRTYENGIEVNLSNTEEASIQLMYLQDKIKDTDAEKLYLINYTQGVKIEIEDISEKDSMEIPVTESGIYGVIAEGTNDTVDLSQYAELSIGTTAINEEYSNIQFCK